MESLAQGCPVALASDSVSIFRKDVDLYVEVHDVTRS
jgi:hypothetical protein